MHPDPNVSATASLVVRAQLGDVGALDALLRHLQGAVFAHIAYIMRDDDGAKDVLQDVLLTVSRRLGQLQHPQLLRAWVFRIAGRAAVRAARRRGSSAHVTLEDVPELAAEGTEVLEDPDVAQLLIGLIDELPTACGMAVRLRYLEELSLVEVAEALDVPLGTVKSRLSYGVSLLRRRMGAPSRS